MLNVALKGQQTKEHDSGVGYSGGLGYDIPSGAVFVRYAVLMDNENDDPAEIQFEDLTSMSIGYKWDLPF